MARAIVATVILVSSDRAKGITLKPKVSKVQLGNRIVHVIEGERSRVEDKGYLMDSEHRIVVVVQLESYEVKKATQIVIDNQADFLHY